MLLRVVNAALRTVAQVLAARCCRGITARSPRGSRRRQTSPDRADHAWSSAPLEGTRSEAAPVPGTPSNIDQQRGLELQLVLQQLLQYRRAAAAAKAGRSAGPGKTCGSRRAHHDACHAAAPHRGAAKRSRPARGRETVCIRPPRRARAGPVATRGMVRFPVPAPAFFQELFLQRLEDVAGLRGTIRRRRRMPAAAAARLPAGVGQLLSRPRHL